jgi:hypothetical protein
MEITRDTMRADGKTVGQAMDEDAAFLRSIGIPAKDGEPTFDEKRMALQEKVRNAVLDALDSVSPSGKGWEDKDLTALFKPLDQHSENLFYRLFDAGYRKF